MEETPQEQRIRRAANFLIDPLRAFIPALDATEDAHVLPSVNVRNLAKPSSAKIRRQTFLLAIQKVRKVRRLSRLDTMAAIRKAVHELQAMRREIVKEETQQEIDAAVDSILKHLA